MKKRVLPLGLVGFLLSFVFLTGCFQYSQKITLRPNGSGTLNISYSVPKGKLLELEDPRFPTQPFEIREVLRKNYTSEDVHLDTVFLDQRTDFVRVYAHFSFRDLSALNQLPRFRNEEYRFLTQQKQTIFEHIIHLTQKDWIEASTLYESGIKLAFQSKLSQQVKVRFAVEMPFPIDSTNAQFTLGKRTAVWRFRLSDLLTQETTHLKIFCKNRQKTRLLKHLRK